MKRTTAPNNVGNKYVDRVGSTPGTILQAEDRNNLQEEICNLLEGYGVTLDGGNDEQLKELFTARLGQDVRVNANVSFARVTVNGEFLPAVPNDLELVVPGNNTIVLPRGMYTYVLDSALKVLIPDKISNPSGGFEIPSPNTIYCNGNGNDAAVQNTVSSPVTADFIKY